MKTVAPTRRYVALARDVLCAAQTRIDGAWCAYVAPVPGSCHADEAQYVADYGTKLRYEVAQAIFPEFANIPYHE